MQFISFKFLSEAKYKLSLKYQMCPKVNTFQCQTSVKGRFLEFRMYHYFADLFYKLSEGTFNKEKSEF